MFGRQLSNKELAWNIFLLVMSSIMAIIGTIWTFFTADWIYSVVGWVLRELELNNIYSILEIK